MQHVNLWHACTKCPLSLGRQHVVLARGSVPADVVFAGEAPGASEDAVGKPFVGPAGRLLQVSVIDRIWEGLPEPKPTYALTNLVACLPTSEDGMKIGEPETADIKACSSRLQQFINLCKPKLVVAVGALAAKWLPTLTYDAKTVEIMHPAAIIRANLAQRGLLIQRAVVTVANAVEEMLNVPSPVAKSRPTPR
jgi:uracil-DNA glycosylase family 4